MKLLIVLFFTSASAIIAQSSDPPIHFLVPGSTLTEADGRAPESVAQEFLTARAGEIGIRSLDGVYLFKQYRTTHNGVTHLIYRQRLQGIDVENAEWTVNIDRKGRVINAGGFLFDEPSSIVPMPAVTSAMKAVRKAVDAVDPAAAKSFQPFQTKEFDGRSASFHGGSLGHEIPASLVWYGARGEVHPAWKFQITLADGIMSHQVIVDGDGEGVFAQRSLTLQQNASKPQGMVYELSPITNPHPGTPRTAPSPFIPRKLLSFSGDPVASPKGWITGTSTSGNNTVTGKNPYGITCNFGIDNCPFHPEEVSSASLDFSFPLEVGAGMPGPVNFSDAATANLFYHVNRVHDLFYSVGFDEASGNFQQVNYSGQGIGGDPVYAYAQFGSAAAGFPSLNNASLASSEQDGVPGRMHMFINPGLMGQMPGFFTDGSLDAETVFHEFTHGVSTRLSRNLYTTFQGRSMGEALSDFFAMEFTVTEGAPPDGVYPFGEYLFFQLDRGIRTRPYSTDMQTNPLTYANLGNVITGPEVHADGEIFVQALWQMRANLIRQHGEKEGRRRARLIVMDGMKLSPPASSMLDMRDAILLADQTDFKGESQTQIWQAFAKRGLGVLAQSASGASFHISANFDVPSPKGSLRLYEEAALITEPARIVLQDSNNLKQIAVIRFSSSTSDVGNLTLRRKGPVFLGTLPTTIGGFPSSLGTVGLLPGDLLKLTYNDEDTGSGASTIEFNAPSSFVYTQVTSPQTRYTFTDERPLGFRAASGSRTVALPFEFPYFEKKFTEVRVYPYGLITLGMPDLTACTDIISLRQIRAIAPMYSSIRTNGSAQASEDIYVSSTADSLTIRWAGETSPVVPLQAPDPVNFAATLFADGRILYQYGTGNKNLGNGSLGTACPAQTATIALSNGHEVFTQESVLSSLGNLENATAIIWHPPFANLGKVEGILETPVATQWVEGVVTVQGIAFETEPTLGISRIDVLIDGRAVTTAQTGLPRPDYCQTQPNPRCPAVGFRRVLDPTALHIEPGSHTLQMRATNWRGVTTTFPEQPAPFQLSTQQGRKPEGRIESPAAGETISGSFVLRGYAYAPDLLISGVDILVDGVTYGRAQYGIARTEVCSGLTVNPPNCPTVGWQFTLATRNGSVFLANGSHVITMRVQDEAGRFTVVGSPVSVTVKNDNTDSSQGVLVTPSNNQILSGVIHISGHAWDTAGRIQSLTLLVDGAGFTTLPYGSPRPTECAALQNVPACPNIGFDLDFDTRRLVNGPHVLGIGAINDRGTATIFPLVVANGMNVVVAN